MVSPGVSSSGVSTTASAANPRRVSPAPPAGAAPGAPHPEPPASERWQRWARKLGRVLLWCSLAAGLGACLAAIAGLLVLQHYSEDLPSVEKLKSGYDPPQVSRIYAGDHSTVLQSVFSERRTVVP